MPRRKVPARVKSVRQQQRIGASSSSPLSCHALARMGLMIGLTVFLATTAWIAYIAHGTWKHQLLFEVGAIQGMLSKMKQGVVDLEHGAIGQQTSSGFAATVPKPGAGVGVPGAPGTYPPLELKRQLEPEPLRFTPPTTTKMTSTTTTTTTTTTTAPSMAPTAQATEKAAAMTRATPAPTEPAKPPPRHRPPSSPDPPSSPFQALASKAGQPAPMQDYDTVQPHDEPCRPIPKSTHPKEYWRQIHYVHVPKCGGTAFGQVIRQAACHINADLGALDGHLDCCLNTSIHCFASPKCPLRPDCLAVHGCRLCDCRHIPQMRYMKVAPSVTMLRDPVTRSTSAFLFRGHSPNWDRFNVRAEFPNFPTKKPKYTFQDYLGFNEYRNIMTRMFALDSFPYRNLTITDVEFENAKNRLSKFKVIGIQEAFDASARLLYKTFKVNIDDSLWKQNYDSKRMPLKSSIARSPKRYAKLQPHMEGTAAANEYDIKLYKWAVGKFCVQLCDAGLWEEGVDFCAGKWNKTCASSNLTVAVLRGQNYLPPETDLDSSAAAKPEDDLL